MGRSMVDHRSVVKIETTMNWSRIHVFVRRRGERGWRIARRGRLEDREEMEDITLDKDVLAMESG